MSHNIAVASSTLLNGVLTFSLKVAEGGTPVTNVDFTFLYEAAKVSAVTVTKASADWSMIPNAAAGELSIAANSTAFDPITSATIPLNPGQTIATISITLANAADTSFSTTMSGLYNETSIPIPSTPLVLGHNVFNSPATGTVDVGINTTLTEDQSISAVPNALADLDHMGTLSYQWLRNGAEIAGATSVDYTLGDLDAGKQMSVRVSWTDGAGNLESKTSAQTAAVANVNDAAGGSLTINGQAVIGLKLTLTNTITDPDGFGAGGFMYEWFAGGTVVGTGDNYTPVAADLNKVITAKAMYTDGFGQVEVKSSAPTAAVIDNRPPGGTLEISGTAIEDGHLNVVDNVTDGDGKGTPAYTWLAGGTQFATGTHAALGQAQVGKQITVVETYTDGLNKVETVTSAAVGPVTNVNDAPTGTVTISGTPTEDQTLTAANTLADEDGLGTITYTWKANGTAIVGASGNTYKLTQAEVGKTITATASYTDPFGRAESVTSNATAAVANVDDDPIGGLLIEGTPTEDQTLSAFAHFNDEDGIPANSTTFQWFAGGTAITGATGTSLVLTQAQVGKTITVQAKYTDAFGAQETVTSSASTAVQNVNDLPGGTLTIGGLAAGGLPITTLPLTVQNAITDEDGFGATGGFSYQWLRDGAAISGATGATYTPVAADVGKKLSVKAMYADAFGAQETVTSAQTLAVTDNRVPTGAVTITGTATQNQTLTANTSAIQDADGLGTFSYKWMANGVVISGATASTFALTEAQVGKTVTVQVNYTDGLGKAESLTSAATAAVANVNDPLTGDITISGTATQGQTLTAANTFGDVDGLGTVSYQWLADGTAISGATGSTLVLAQAHVNKAITVRGSYTDGHGTAEGKTSAATGRVANANDAPTGRPTISNTTPSQGQTLTASTSGIADADGLGTFSFQWLAGGVAITGATTASLALAQAQVGKEISVRASFTDGFGASESVTSVATTAVKNVNDAPTGTVTLDGARVVGLPMEANTSAVADPDGLGTFSFQWLRGTTVITGASGRTYSPVAADAGTNLSVKVSYTDAQGTAESLSSAAVAIVQEDNVTPLSAPSVTPTAGDGNGDGIKDSQQAAVVSAPLAIIGSTNNTFVTLVVDSTSTGAVNTGSTAVIQQLDQEAAPGNKPGKMSAPMGLIDFVATTPVKGQTETFTLFVDRALGVNGYWKQDAGGTWVNLASSPFGGATTFVGNKIRLDFKITDGGTFDNDKTADGIITDPAIVGQMPLSVVGYAPDVTLTATTHFFF